MLHIVDELMTIRHPDLKISEKKAYVKPYFNELKTVVGNVT